VCLPADTRWLFIHAKAKGNSTSPSAQNLDPDGSAEGVSEYGVSCAERVSLGTDRHMLGNWFEKLQCCGPSRSQATYPG
jgi:hypothetical protein